LEQKALPKIIEAKISVKSQNTEGTRTHYEVTAIVTTTKNRLTYTESGWIFSKFLMNCVGNWKGNLPNIPIIVKERVFVKEG